MSQNLSSDAVVTGALRVNIIYEYILYKAVVGGPAGLAMTGPLFLPEMVLAGPHFWPNIFLQGRFLTFLL